MRKTYFAIGGFSPSQPMPRFYRFVSQNQPSDHMVVRRVDRCGRDIADTDESIYEGDPTFWTDALFELTAVARMAEAYEKSCEELGMAYLNTLETLNEKASVPGR